MKSPPPIGTVYELDEWPDFPEANKRRFIVLTATAGEPGSCKFKAAPLTTQCQNLSADQRIDITPTTHSSVYRSRSNRDGLPPRDSCIGLTNYITGNSAIAEITVWATCSAIEVPTGQFVTVHKELRFSRKDWDAILRGVPPAAHDQFHHYDEQV